MTRGQILDCANARFLAESYDKVGLRDIARDAGIDPALVLRYFGSKEDLFASVLDRCDHAAGLTQDERRTFGNRVARHLVQGDGDPLELRWILLMLHAIASPAASAVIRRRSGGKFHPLVADWVGGEDAEIKARLAVGLIMGLAASRNLLGCDLTADQCDILQGRIATILQDVVDG